MNLNEINTPAQLIEANKNNTPTPTTEHTDDTLYDLALEHLDYPEAVRLVARLTEQLACFHQSQRAELIESQEAERATYWSYDEALLSVALDALKRIIID